MRESIGVRMCVRMRHRKRDRTHDGADFARARVNTDNYMYMSAVQRGV